MQRSIWRSVATIPSKAAMADSAIRLDEGLADRKWVVGTLEAHDVRLPLK
jgi:hypothetical protein